MRHPETIKWEQKLKSIFDEIDDYLETSYGADYPLHPARPSRGSTANKEHDGLFNIGASFSSGLGSEYGPGYILEIRMVTLSHVPSEVRERIEQEVVELLRRKLPEKFEGKSLRVVRDRNVYKIYGDLSLGNV
ncbi:MAG: hypothetical protein JW881_00605 [Spirochaetales bacterium]|nr:hypothetical protein [Spirochaetales bacterium]